MVKIKKAKIKKAKIIINLSDLSSGMYDAIKLKKHRVHFKNKQYYKNPNYDKEKISGYLDFIYEASIKFIYSIKWQFEELTIDRCQTKSWEKKSIANHKYRKDIFKKLNIEKCDRPKYSRKSKLYSLNKEEISLFNEYINFQYPGTIKGILSIIFGTNAKGGVSSPEDEQVIKTDCNESACNKIYCNNSDKPAFMIFLQNVKIEEFIKEESYKENKINLFNSTESDNTYFEKLAENMKNLYNSLNTFSKKNEKTKESNRSNFKKYTGELKKYIKKIIKEVHYGWLFLENFQKKSNSLRSAYKNEINTKKDDFFTFENLWRKQQIQKAHIYPVHQVKEDVYIYWQKDKNKLKNIKLDSEEYKNQLNKISDPENYLSLEYEFHHSIFDKELVTYNTKGELCKLINDKEEDEKYLKDYFKDPISKKYLNIKSACLKKRRINYIKLRNQKLKNSGREPKQKNCF